MSCQQTKENNILVCDWQSTLQTLLSSVTPLLNYSALKSGRGPVCLHECLCVHISSYTIPCLGNISFLHLPSSLYISTHSDPACVCVSFRCDEYAWVYNEGHCSTVCNSRTHMGTVGMVISIWLKVNDTCVYSFSKDGKLYWERVWILTVEIPQD